MYYVHANLSQFVACYLCYFHIFLDYVSREIELSLVINYVFSFSTYQGLNFSDNWCSVVII